MCSNSKLFETGQTFKSAKTYGESYFLLTLQRPDPLVGPFLFVPLSPSSLIGFLHGISADAAVAQPSALVNSSAATENLNYRSILNCNWFLPMTSFSMDKTKPKKQSDKETLAEVTKEMAKPRVAASVRGEMTSEPDDPMELLREEVKEKLAAPSQASTGTLLTPSLNATLKTLGLRATLLTWPT
jgi:hypothetical protein